MDEETDFAALYKKLINDFFPLEPERAGTVLHNVLECLASGNSPEIPMENNR